VSTSDAGGEASAGGAGTASVDGVVAGVVVPATADAVTGAADTAGAVTIGAVAGWRRAKNAAAAAATMHMTATTRASRPKLGFGGAAAGGSSAHLALRSASSSVADGAADKTSRSSTPKPWASSAAGVLPA